MNNLIIINKSYKITNEDYKKCEDFAKKINSSEYIRRGSKPEAINNQLIYSKLAEMYTEKLLKSTGYIITKPTDFKIYSNEKKNFDADLKIYSNKHNKEFEVNVKLCMQSRYQPTLYSTFLNKEYECNKEWSAWGYYINNSMSYIDVGNNNTIQILCDIKDNSIVISYMVLNLLEYYKEVFVQPYKDLSNKAFLNEYLLLKRNKNSDK